MTLTQHACILSINAAVLKNKLESQVILHDLCHAVFDNQANLELLIQYKLLPGKAGSDYMINYRVITITTSIATTLLSTALIALYHLCTKCYLTFEDYRCCMGTEFDLNTVLLKKDDNDNNNDKNHCYKQNDPKEIAMLLLLSFYFTLLSDLHSSIFSRLSLPVPSKKVLKSMRNHRHQTSCNYLHRVSSALVGTTRRSNFPFFGERVGSTKIECWSFEMYVDFGAVHPLKREMML